MFLLDINVLIAVLDPSHVHHERTADWFSKHHPEGWATCPLTENGFIRILSHPKYPAGPTSSETARTLLIRLRLQPAHQFWADEISLCDPLLFPKLGPSKHLTDAYLLALAAKRESQFVTLDKRIEPSLVKEGTHALYVMNS